METVRFSLVGDLSGISIKYLTHVCLDIYKTLYVLILYLETWGAG